MNLINTRSINSEGKKAFLVVCAVTLREVTDV